MVLTRKQQLLGAIETTPGGGGTLTGSDAILVYDPSISDSPDFLDRTPSGATLSGAFQPPGRKTRELSFQTDFRGSGGAAEPEFAMLLKACGYAAVPAVQNLTCGSVSGGTGYFVVGERVTQATSDAEGIVVAITSGGSSVDKAASSGDVLVVARTSSSAFNAVNAVTGASSGAGTTPSGAATRANSFSYAPTSESLMQIGFSADLTGAAAGKSYNIERGGELVGGLTVVEVTALDDLNVTLLWGSIANGDVVTDGTNTATLNAAPTVVKGPTLVFWHNLDGRRRELKGARGTFSMQGSVGEPLQFSWTFQGDIGSDLDVAPAASSATSSVKGPRLLGAVVAVGEYDSDANVYRMPIKSINLDNAGTVSPNLDANSPGGATGANITDRDSTIQITVDNVNGAFDWEAMRDNGTAVRFAAVLVDANGNPLSVVAPHCQVAEVSLSDANGISVFDVTLRPMRIAESGDDDLYFSQL
jgi:hypothetical protein